MPTYVCNREANDGWMASVTTSTAFEGARLSVFRVHEDEANEYGGLGTTERHPEHDGMSFPDSDAAQAFKLEHGYIVEWTVALQVETYERMGLEPSEATRRRWASQGAR